jgi:hypothetical protein
MNPSNTTSTTHADTMAPSTLDLFILTFNCAKNLINPPVFASHLYGALSQQGNETGTGTGTGAGLPGLVVL